MAWSWDAHTAHASAIAPFGSWSKVPQRDTQPRRASGMAMEPRCGLEPGRPTEERLTATPSRHLPPVRSTNQLVPNGLPSSHLLYSVSHNILPHLTWHLEDTGMAEKHHSNIWSSWVSLSLSIVNELESYKQYSVAMKFWSCPSLLFHEAHKGCFVLFYYQVPLSHSIILGR